MINTRSARRLWALLLFFAVALAIAIVLVPAFLIQPFKPQTTSQIEVSYLLRRWSPLLTILIAIGAGLIAALMWRGARAWWRKAALAACVLVAVGTVWASRQNHFEWMFNPLPDARFSVANETTFVAPDDVVMGIEIDGESVAYPVRQMAYHHIVQDTVGRTPIAATY
jgi:hypothetical protein